MRPRLQDPPPGCWPSNTSIFTYYRETSTRTNGIRRTTNRKCRMLTYYDQMWAAMLKRRGCNINLWVPLACLMLTCWYPISPWLFCGPPHISRTSEITYVRHCVYSVYRWIEFNWALELSYNVAEALVKRNSTTDLTYYMYFLQ